MFLEGALVRSLLVRILIQNDNTDNKVFKKLLYIDP